MYRKLLPWHVDQQNHTLCIKEVQNEHFQEENITLLNWNVHKNNHSFKWLHDFEQILHQYKPHLITFQEYKTKSRRSVLDNHKQYGYGFFANIEMYEHDYGLMNASTCAIEKFNPVFSKDVEPFTKTPKVNLFTRYNFIDNQKITLVNTHLINFVQTKKYLSQIKQIENLCQGEEKLILSGDFNTWNSKRMHILKSMTDDLGLSLVNFETPSHKKSYLSHPLDHVFYRGVKPTKSEILKNIKTSDHKPMIVEFETDI